MQGLSGFVRELLSAKIDLKLYWLQNQKYFTSAYIMRGVFYRMVFKKLSTDLDKN